MARRGFVTILAPLGSGDRKLERQGRVLSGIGVTAGGRVLANARLLAMWQEDQRARCGKGRRKAAGKDGAGSRGNRLRCCPGEYARRNGRFCHRAKGIYHVGFTDYPDPTYP